MRVCEVCTRPPISHGDDHEPQWRRATAEERTAHKATRLAELEAGTNPDRPPDA